MAAIALVVCVATSAHADDDLAEAIRLEAALEYDQALAVVTRILDRGTATDPAQVAELHFYAGRLAAGLDRTDLARDHFARALALKPDLALPAGTSPKLTAPFDAARAATVPLRVHATDHQVFVDADPLGLVARTELAGRQAHAFDLHGNVVWRGEVPAPAPPPAPAPGTSVAARWSTWAAESGAAVVIGGLCARRFQVAQDDWNTFSQDGMHDYTQLRAIETRGDHWGLAADVSFGVAAAAGVTAAILYVTHRPAPVVVGDRFVGVAAVF
jgi:predicted secreted protein